MQLFKQRYVITHRPLGRVDAGGEASFQKISRHLRQGGNMPPKAGGGTIIVLLPAALCFITVALQDLRG